MECHELLCSSLDELVLLACVVFLLSCSPLHFPCIEQYDLHGLMEREAPLQMDTTPEYVVEQRRDFSVLEAGFCKREDSSPSTAAAESHNYGLTGSTAVVSDEFRTGIRLRTRQRQPSIENPDAQGIALQGTAPRRIRLQCKLQMRPVRCSAACESKPIAAEVRSLLCETRIISDDCLQGMRCPAGA